MMERGDRLERKSTRHARLLGGLLVAFSFFLTWWIGKWLYALHVLSQYDAWFETDPSYYMTVFTKGPVWFNVRHPILAELGHVPVAIVAKALTTGCAPNWGSVGFGPVEA